MGAVVLLAASFLFGYNVGRTRPDSEAEFRLLAEVEEFIDTNAVKTKSERELIQGAIRGMLQSLDDPYAAYLDPSAFADFSNDLSGQFSGVGVWLKQENDQVKVVSVLPGTPAARAGIVSGDAIISVNGKAITNLTLDEVVRRIQGRAGTTVALKVVRGEEPEREFKLQREQIEIPAVTSQMLKGRVGLIELITFTRGSGEKVRESVKALNSKGAKGFILDLRGNPGGLVDEAVEVSGVFLESGRVVSYKERDREEVVYEAKGTPETNLPLVVLVDEGSASAAEIVAGAIQDRGRGIVVGNETYGKGSIQSPFRLSDGSAIKLTVASYFTPSGRSIGERGIIPDVVVQEKPNQLARAQEVISGILAERPFERTG